MGVADRLDVGGQAPSRTQELGADVKICRGTPKVAGFWPPFKPSWVSHRHTNRTSVGEGGIKKDTPTKN